MNRFATRRLWVCFAASLAIYASLLLLGPRYALPVPVAERPILLVLGLYLIAFVVYFVALALVLRTAATRRLTWWLISTSIAFRALLLPTPPFQEIDIYRYLWDGAVVAAGCDPYVVAPQAVVDRLDGVPSHGDERSERLAGLAGADPALNEIAREIHYAELPSPYPPVSQAVFAAAAMTTPGESSAFGRLVWLKAWLTVFDVMTLLLVIWLLRLTELPVGWALAYGWCPLVLKEVAGSGHLDAIATFLCVAALAVGSIALMNGGRWRLALLASLLLGLGVGAKLYPIVLAPLLAAGLLRRYGWRVAGAGAVVFMLTVGVSLWPMLAGGTSPQADANRKSDEVESIPLPPDAVAEPVGKTAGLEAFLKQWEMNDLLFMVVYENLRWRPADTPAQVAPWFDFTPAAWSKSFQGDDARAFVVTRGLTLIVFAAIAFYLAWRAAARFDGSSADIRGWLGAAFLALAWFWLLAPTQNPWYWCWAAPLLPWAGSRVWLVMGAAAMAYYLRFWLETAFPEPGLLGTPYNGEYFFYFIVPWFEFGPLLAWLAWDATRGPRETKPGWCPAAHNPEPPAL